MSVEFSPPTNIPTGINPTVVITADLNRDGNVDLVTNFDNFSASPNTSGKTGVSVLLGNGTGQFGAAQNYALEQTVPNLLYQQFQQVIEEQFQQYQQFVQTLPPGAFVPPFNPPTNPYPPTSINSVTVRDIASADVNRDGKLDLITAGTISVTEPQGSFASIKQRVVISVLPGDGIGGFGLASYFLINGVGAATAIAIADFNSDGNLDVATVRNYSPDGNPALKQQVAILSGDGNGNFGNEKILPIGQDTTDIIAADFNGDGRSDLAVSTFESFYGYGSSANVTVLLANGTGGFTSAGSFPSNINSNITDLLVADFNGDGKLDIAGSGGFLPGDGTGKFGSPVYSMTSIPVVASDFNGDGRLDFATGVSGGYGPSGVSVLLGNGAGNYSYPAPMISGATPGNIVVGDFNKDGRPDLATINYALGSGSSTLSVALNATTSSDALVITADVIDASSETSGGLKLDLAKKTLQLGAISQTLNGSYGSIRGTVQADQISGSKGKETIDGIAGNDVIVGLDGNDRLNGGFGNDTLTGGKGKDTFTFMSDGLNYQTIPFNRSFGVDKITDFTPGQDKIELYRDTFTALGKRLQFAVVDTKRAAQKNRALITYIPKTGRLYYNANGAKSGFGSGGLFADLSDGLVLTAKSFSVV